MAFDQEELEQLKEMFDVQQSSIIIQMSTIFDERLDTKLAGYRSVIANDTRAIVTESEERLGKRIDQIRHMESEDIQAAYVDIEDLKKTTRQHDVRLKTLES